MSQMRLGLDSNSNTTFKIGKFSGHHILLSPDVEQTVIVPSTVDTRTLKITGVLINHSKSSDLLYKNAPVADVITVPANGPTNFQALNPGLRSVKPGDVLHFRSPIASQVQLEWMFEDSSVWNK